MQFYSKFGTEGIRKCQGFLEKIQQIVGRFMHSFGSRSSTINDKEIQVYNNFKGHFVIEGRVEESDDL